MSSSKSRPSRPRKSSARIDVQLVALGLAKSRERAQALILANQVLVDDVPVTKPGQTIDIQSRVRLRDQQDHPYVSRGGLKLAAALDAFSVGAEGRAALDVGASTGGFTDVLLQRHVRIVYAVDVGVNQLDWKIRSDPKVRAFEKINARSFAPEDLGPEFQPVDLIVIDVSFISLTKILTNLLRFSSTETDWIALIKPQFEVGREQIGKNGIVTDDLARNQACERVCEFAESLGLTRRGLINSPITGTQGNIEFLCHWKRA